MAAITRGRAGRSCAGLRPASAGADWQGWAPGSPGAIVGDRTDSALIRVSSPVYKAVLEISERLITYMQAVNLVLGECLPD